MSIDHMLPRKIVTAVALSLCASASLAQTASWQKLSDQAKAAYQCGELQAAEKLYGDALEQARQSGKKDPMLAMSLNNLGNLYCAEGKYKDAQPLLDESVTVLKGLLGPNNTNVATALNNLANCESGVGNAKGAEVHYRSALAINQKSTDPKRSLVASLNGLTNVLIAQNRLNEAKTFAQEALTYVEKHPEQDVASQANAYSQSASVYANLKDFKAAEPLLRKAVALDEKAFGKNSRQFVVDTNNLAALKQRQGNGQEASKLYEQAANSSSASGTNPEGKIASLSSLASMADQNRQYDKAADYLNQAVTLAKQASDPDNEELVELENSLACVYLEQSRYDDAEKLLYAAIATAQDLPNPPLEMLAVGCNNVGQALFKQQKYGEAEVMMQRSIDIREKLKGPNDPSLGLALNNLATIYSFDGKYSDAEPLYKRAISILERAPDAKSDLKTCYESYAGMLQASGDQNDASALAAKAQNIH
jgi:tetratricopeptide (TPR) repeat protein